MTTKRTHFIESLSNKLTTSIYATLGLSPDDRTKQIIQIQLMSGLLTAFHSGEMEGLEKGRSILHSLTKKEV